MADTKKLDQETQDKKDFREKVDSTITGFGEKLRNAVMGSPEANAKAKAEMQEMDKKNPESSQAKVNKAVGMKKGGSVSSASKRADGIATKGKTKGRIV